MKYLKTGLIVMGLIISFLFGKEIQETKTEKYTAKNSPHFERFEYCKDGVCVVEYISNKTVCQYLLNQRTNTQEFIRCTDK